MESAPKKHRRRWAWFLLGFFMVYSLLGILPPISWTTTRVNRVAHGVEIRQKIHHEFSVERFLPSYWRDHCAHDRTVFVDGKEWVEAKHSDMLGTSISPDRTYIVLGARGGGREPIRILDLPARRMTKLIFAVDVPEDEYAVHVEPYKLLRWEDDSHFLMGNFFATMVEDTFQEEDITKKRLYWRVDAKTATYISVASPTEP